MPQRPLQNSPLKAQTENVAREYCSFLLRKGAECCLHLVVQFNIENLLVMLFCQTRHMELHTCDLDDQVFHRRSNDTPSNLMLTRTFRDCFLCRLVEADDDL